MKKIFPILAILVVTLFLGGCIRFKQKDDLIPKKLGEPEGLWLYREAERMRTDGSECELLFNEVELDGEMYAAKDYKVKNYLYCKDTKTIFFVLTVVKSDYLYCYNYAEKWGKQLSGGYKETRWSYSDYYFCFRSWNQEGEAFVRLFLRDGTLVCEDLMYTDFWVLRDILFKYGNGRSEEEGAITWWKDGDWHTVSIPAWEGIAENFYDGDLIYHFDFTEDGTGFAVDVDTKEVYSIPYEGRFCSYERIVNNGVLWFITREKKQITDESSDRETYCRLYRFTTAGCELVYTFEKNTFSFVGITGEKIYLEMYDNYSEKSYQYYDIASGTLKDGEKPYEEKDKTFTYGEYTFWVEYETFWYKQVCYYLYRQHGEKVEIMQYTFGHKPVEADLRLFFDDICEF